MIKRQLDARIGHLHLDNYLQEGANDQHIAKPLSGFVIKGYVLDTEEIADNTVIGNVEQRFRRLRNLAA